MVGFGKLGASGLIAILLGVTTPIDAEPTVGERMVGDVMVAIQQDFPADFAAMASASKQKGSDSVPSMIRDLFDRNTRHLARAPAPALLELVEAELGFIQSVQRESTFICAKYGESTVIELGEVSEGSEALGGKLGPLKLHAARAGIDQPVNRPTERIAPRDKQAWIDAMKRAGVSQVTIDMYFGKKPAEGIDADSLCAAHVMAVAAILDMSPDAGANVAAIRYSNYFAAFM